MSESSVHYFNRRDGTYAGWVCKTDMWTAELVSWRCEHPHTTWKQAIDCAEKQVAIRRWGLVEP